MADSVKRLLESKLTHNRHRQKKVSVQIYKYPKGSLQTKIINQCSYVYLTYRDENSILTEYIGPPSSSRVKRVSAMILERKKLIEELRSLKREAHAISRSLNNF